ncbi:retrovirus-related pol polyprotein from transposon TNT 1-94 [Tanacetum coccineum]
MGTNVTSSSGSVLEEHEIQKLQIQAKIFKENSLNKLNALKSTAQLLENQSIWYQQAFARLFGDSFRTFPFQLSQTLKIIRNTSQCRKKPSRDGFQIRFKVSFSSDREVIETFRDYTTMTAETFKETIIQNMNSIEQCIKERASHEQELKMTLKKLSERQLQIPKCKVQEVQSSVTSSGDETSSGIVSDEEIEKKELEAHYGFMAKIQDVLPAESSSTDTPLEQSIQTIHMLAPKCSTYNGRPTFANPRYLKKAQLYEEAMLEFDQKLDKETVKPYDYTRQNSLYEIFKGPSLEYLYQLERGKEVRKTIKGTDEKQSQLCNENASNVFRKEREQYHEITRFENAKGRQEHSVSRPQLKSYQVKDKVVPNNSQVKLNHKEVEEHHKISSISRKTKSVITCNDSSKSRTLNVNAVCAECGKCMFNSNHDACVSRYLNDVNARTKKPKVVPISASKPKRKANKSVATPHKKTVASDTTIQKSKSYYKELYENTNQEWKWWIAKKCPSGYKWTQKPHRTKKIWMPKIRKEDVSTSISPTIDIVSRITNIVQLILFIVDSGCTKHMTGNLKLLCNFVEKFLGTVRFGNDQFAPILGYGDLNQGNITIKRVYYVEGLNHNLFLVGQLCDADLEVAFRKSTCFVRDLQGNDLLTGNRGSDLYTISLQETTSSTPICFMAKASPTQAWLWHRRLSHLNFDYITLLSKKDIVTGLPKLKYVKDQLCSSCEISKAKRSSFKSKAILSSKGRLNLLHMDLCGLMRVASINGKKYILVIVDDYLRYTWTLFLRSKDETPEVLKDFLTMI